MKINDLLLDHNLLGQIEDLVTTGASIGTVEASLGMAPGALKRWLTKGEARPRTPYRVLFQKYRTWAAQARAVAESQQLAKSPGQWLEKNTSSRIVETPQEEAPTAPLLEGTPSVNVSPQQLLDSLTTLADAGISIDQALLTRQIRIEQPGT